MIYAFSWFLFALAVSLFADRRGRSGAGWFILALVISPLIAFIFLAILPDLALEHQSAVIAHSFARTHIKCPYCAEMIRREALVCRFCANAQPPPLLENKSTPPLAVVRPNPSNFEEPTEVRIHRIVVAVGVAAAGITVMIVLAAVRWYVLEPDTEALAAQSPSAATLSEVPVAPLSAPPMPRPRPVSR